MPSAASRALAPTRSRAPLPTFLRGRRALRRRFPRLPSPRQWRAALRRRPVRRLSPGWVRPASAPRLGRSWRLVSQPVLQVQWAAHRGGCPLEQDRDESDSDDSAAIDLRQEEQEDLEATVKPFLRSIRSKRGSGSKKRSNPSGGTQGGGSKGKYSKGRGTRGGAAAWLGVGAALSPSACRRARWARGTASVRGCKAQPALAAVLYLGVGSPGIEPTCPHLHRQH